MSALHGVPVVLVLAAAAGLSGCDAVDRARSRLSTPADTVVPAVSTGSGLTLGLQTPGLLRPGQEGLLRLSVTNRSDTVAAHVRVELFVPGWVEPLPPRAGDREVSMAAVDGGTRFVYRLDDTPIQPNQAESVEQRIRVPAAGPITEGAEPWSRVVRARLIGPDGQALAEVASEVALDGVGGQLADTVAERPIPADTARPVTAPDTARPIGRQ